MGRIGHETLLHSLKWWQIRAAFRHECEARPTWESTRWLASVIAGLLGAKDIKKPSDLCEFGWERRRQAAAEGDEGGSEEMPTEEEIRKLQEEMRRLNEQNTVK